jgi:hypothetical protein
MLVIVMAMVMCRCNTAHIAQHDRSRATLDATGRHHRASICPVSPRWTTVVINFGVKS